MIVGARRRLRSGTIGVATLIAVPVLLVLAGLVIYVGFLRDARTETQTGADAAALAAARALATDDLLTDDVERAASRLNRSRSAAVALAYSNIAGGERLQLDLNSANDPAGDIVFGQLDQPLFGRFDVADGDAAECVGDRVNAVRVTVRRCSVKAPLGGCAPDRDVLGSATAMLDWRVVGFRPNDDSPIPLMPIGICTDHKGELPYGWDAHCRRRDRDEWRFDPQTQTFIKGRDGIPEVTVVLGRRSQEREVPGAFLQIGANSFGETVDQLRSGMNREQLREFGTSGFVLGPDNTLHVRGTPLCPTAEQPARKVLDAALRGLRDSGEARIWPLFSDVNEEDGTVRLSGWTAARVVACVPAAGGGIELTLQPAVVCHPSAVTEHRSSPPAFWAINRAVCRVRLAE